LDAYYEPIQPELEQSGLKRGWKYVRAGDAIHLASAKDAGFQEIWTNDRRLLQAAQYFDLVGKSV